MLIPTDAAHARVTAQASTKRQKHLAPMCASIRRRHAPPDDWPDMLRTGGESLERRSARCPHHAVQCSKAESHRRRKTRLTAACQQHQRQAPTTCDMHNAPSSESRPGWITCVPAVLICALMCWLKRILTCERCTAPRRHLPSSNGRRVTRRTNSASICWAKSCQGTSYPAGECRALCGIVPSSLPHSSVASAEPLRAGSIAGTVRRLDMEYRHRASRHRMAVLSMRWLGVVGYRAMWPLHRHHVAAMASFHCGTAASLHKTRRRVRPMLRNRPSTKPWASGRCATQPGPMLRRRVHNGR